MQINITGHGCDVTAALRRFTEDKFQRLERHHDRITSINVTFNVEKIQQIADCTIHVAGGEIHASSRSEDLYSSIDGLIDKLDRQLIKHKEKARDHREKNPNGEFE